MEDGGVIVVEGDGAIPEWVAEEFAKLGRLGGSVRQLSDAAEELARDLSRSGRYPWCSRSLRCRLGELLCLRLELRRAIMVHSTAVNGSTAWAARLAPRWQALEDEMSAAEVSLNTVLKLSQGRYSGALEWTIIALIALDIVVMLLWH